MARLTEEMVIARSKQSDLSNVKKLNCWGAELGDVSLVRQMPNIEVLALSLNRISSLAAFAWCPRLRELYVRKNDIRELREIRHLRRLPHLTALWLDENPCTLHPQYRLTVLRNLPQLEKLDNQSVTQEEVAEAMRRGAYMPDSDDEDQQQVNRSAPEQVRYVGGSDDGAECGGEPPPQHLQSWGEEARCPAESPMTRSHYEASSGGPARECLRASQSAHSVKDYEYPTNGESRYSGGSMAPTHDTYEQRPERVPTAESTTSYRDRDAVRSAVMAERRVFTRRPVARNSNLLSAVLCLVKELDYPSLEVVEMAVRCRMDELADEGQ